MNIVRGQRLRVVHSRKGTFYAIATADFDSATAEWYPLVVDPDGGEVKGLVNEWEPGETVPCRAGLCTVTPVGVLA